MTNARGRQGFQPRSLLNWHGVRDAWQVYSEYPPTPIPWSGKVRRVLGDWRRTCFLVWVARGFAGKTDAPFTEKLRVFSRLLDGVLDVQRDIECPGWGWYGVETSLLVYYLCRVRRFFLQQRRDWLQAKLHVVTEVLWDEEFLR